MRGDTLFWALLHGAHSSPPSTLSHPSLFPSIHALSSLSLFLSFPRLLPTKGPLALSHFLSRTLCLSPAFCPSLSHIPPFSISTLPPSLSLSLSACIKYLFNFKIIFLDL